MIRFISVCLRVTNIYSVFKSYIYNEHLSIPGAPIKNIFLIFPPSQNCSMKRKRRITLRFHKSLAFVLVSAGLRHVADLVSSAAKRRTKTKYQLDLKMKRSRRPADLAITERALATRGCRRDFRNPFRAPPSALAGRLSRPPNDGT